MTKTAPITTAIWLLTAAAFFAFFVFGFSDNLKGPILPSLLDDLEISYTLGGTILLGAYLGFMVATLTTGLLADTVGLKAVLVLAGICLALGVVGFTAFSAPILLTASLAVLGFGMGSLELGCNTLIVKVHPHAKGRYLNLMAVMHGLGSMVAPLYAGWLLADGISWRSVYRWDLVPIALLALGFVAVRFPAAAAANGEKLDFRRIGRSAFTVRMLLYYFAIAIYVAAELGMASWMVEYLQKTHALSVGRSTQALSLFFGLVMVGRLVGSFFIERVGYLRSVLWAALAGSACLALGLYASSGLVILIPASGFFLSIIFPTITASVSSAQSKNLSTTLGLLFTFAGLGGILGPWLVGVAGDLGGIQLGFSLNLAFCLLSAAAVFILIRLNLEHA